MQTVILATANNGDGSHSPVWFRRKVTLSILEDTDCERFGGNEGGTEYRFPDDFCFDTCGICFYEDYFED